MSWTVNPIRTTDRAGIDGIIAEGRPSGYWIAESGEVPRAWIGALVFGGRTVTKSGTFGEVLEWLQFKSGILSEERSGVKRQAGERIFGIRVTWEGRQWLSPDAMERAEIYAGFSCRASRGPSRASHMKPSAAEGGIRHGNAGADNARNRAVQERDELILQLSREGLLQKDIALRLGVTPTTVNNRVRVMRKAGIDVPSAQRERERAVRLERAERFRRMRDEEGLRAPEISRRTGIHMQTVYSLLALADKLKEGGDEMQGG